MLTKKEIDSLHKGNYPNSKLRAKFGTKHGQVVKGMSKDKDGNLHPVEFIGNRRQYSFSKKAKSVGYPVDQDYGIQPSSLPNKKPTPKKGFFGKVGDFFKRAFL